MSGKPKVYIEERFDLSEWGLDGAGRVDCALLCGNDLHIFDFKYGKGVPVSAEKNEQLLLYALGVYSRGKMCYKIDRVHVNIIQPRLSNEASTWECSIGKLLAFGEQVKRQAALATAGEGEFNPSTEACRFCRAKATCRARADHNVRLAFEEKDNLPVTDYKANLLSPDEIGMYLAYGADVAKWVKDLEEYALSECLAGHEITGWKAVEGRGSREWTDQEAAFTKIMEAGTPEIMLYETLPLSLAKVEKLVGKKAFTELVGDLVEKKPGKPTLVPADDKREAITNVMTAKEAFKE